MNGRAPAPVGGQFGAVDGSGAVQGAGRYTWDQTTGRFDYTVTPPPGLVVMAIHRMEGQAVGPIVAHLARRGGAGRSGTLTFRGRDREDLVAGRLAVRIYTEQQPLGGPPLPLRVP